MGATTIDSVVPDAVAHEIWAFVRIYGLPFRNPLIDSPLTFRASSDTLVQIGIECLANDKCERSEVRWIFWLVLIIKFSLFD